MLFSQIPLLLIQMCLRNLHLQHIGPVKKKTHKKTILLRNFAVLKLMFMELIQNVSIP